VSIAVHERALISNPQTRAHREGQNAKRSCRAEGEGVGPPAHRGARCQSSARAPLGAASFTTHR
jgi:hypothetical protein